MLEGMEARRLRTGVGSAFVEGFNPAKGPSAKGDTTQQEKNRQEGAGACMTGSRAWVLTPTVSLRYVSYAPL